MCAGEPHRHFHYKIRNLHSIEACFLTRSVDEAKNETLQILKHVYDDCDVCDVCDVCRSGNVDRHAHALAHNYLTEIESVKYGEEDTQEAAA